ncbi:MAG: DUF1858 domain-containing protein, partial [Patescibacteria group bacterium]|nr:DUF1858 domain-containing protein [Patescibacteria group bacterium]
IFDNGKVTYQPVEGPVEAEITISVPGWLAQELVLKDISWDEAHVGYWCIFSRNPDVYNIYFWQLLYAPWEARKESNSKIFDMYSLSLDSSIADLIEKEGKVVSDVLEKFGLYCTGCYVSVGETVEDGCRMHGIDPKKTEELITELKQVIKLNHTNKLQSVN